MYPLFALLTPLPRIPFTTEDISGCTNEAAKGANKAPRNPPAWFFVSFFTVSVTPSINTTESSYDVIILIISFMATFKTNKVNPFPALTAPFPLVFLSDVFTAFKVKLLTNPGKFALDKGIAIFVSVFFFSLNYLTKNLKMPLIELF